jgi:hypothetical protein
MWDRRPSSGNQAAAAWRGMRADHFDVVRLHGTYRIIDGFGRELEHALETAGRIHHQESRFRRLDGKGVRDTPPERNEPTLASVIVFASDVEHPFAVEHAVFVQRPRTMTWAFQGPERLRTAPAPPLAIWPVQLVPHVV